MNYEYFFLNASPNRSEPEPDALDVDSEDEADEVRALSLCLSLSLTHTHTHTPLSLSVALHGGALLALSTCKHRRRRGPLPSQSGTEHLQTRNLRYLKTPASLLFPSTERRGNK